MKWILALLLVGCLGCDGTLTIGAPDTAASSQEQCSDGVCPYPTVPPMDLPVQLREENYAGGSCVHASMVSVLRWQGFEELADWWQGQYRGGEGIGGLVSKADRTGLRFAYTSSGDTDFLEWCSRTRRGAVIFYYSAHSITFCGFNSGDAVVMDNNRVDKLIRIPKADFLRRWRGYGGVALTPVYSPNPPRPWRMVSTQEKHK